MKSTTKFYSNQNYRISSNKRWNSNTRSKVSHSGQNKRVSLINVAPQIEVLIINLTIIQLPLN